VAAVLTITALASSACSSSAGQPGNSASGPARSNGSQQTPSTTATCAAKAQAAVSAAQESISPSVPAQPVDSAKLRGKSIWFISSTQAVKAIVDISDGARAAAAAAGLTFHVYDGQASPSQYNDGIAQAIAQHANGIILQGIQSSLVTQSLKTATAAGIPVIDAMNGDPGQTLQNGISAHVTVNFTQSGKELADYALAATKCNLNANVMTSSLFEAHVDRTAGFKAEVGTLCSSCKVTTEQVDFANLSSSVSQIVTSALVRDPSLNYLVATDDSEAFYAAAAVSTATRQVPIISGNGDATNLAYVLQQRGQVMDVSFAPLGYVGWVEIDRLQRAMLKMPVPVGTIPQQMIDASNVQATSAEQFPNFSHFEAKFLAAWGIS
jgi:ribose transport system substrate-binding protein